MAAERVGGVSFSVAAEKEGRTLQVEKEGGGALPLVKAE